MIWSFERAFDEDVCPFDRFNELDGACEGFEGVEIANRGGKPVTMKCSNSLPFLSG